MLRSLHFSKWKRLGAIGLGLVIASSANMMAVPTLSQDAATGLYALQAENTSIKEVLSYIENNSEYIFVYSEGVNSKLSKKIDIDLKGKSMTELLKEMCTKAGLAYTINGRQVIISLPQQSAPTKAERTYTLNGNVTDADDEPLPGVSVTIAGKKEGVATDLDGNFSISVTHGEKLNFSYLGFSNATVEVKGQNNIHVTLEETTSTLDEVVVIGYGVVKKKDLTGAVSAVNGADLAAKKTTTLSTALQGSVPGLMVRRNNNAPGASASSMHIRGVTTIGDSSPLIIVDGMECDNIDYVNPNDVESVSVLKDAAAASIYGSKAAAGVILITTKRGSDTDMSITYTGEFGWEIPTQQPTMVGVTRYLEMYNELLYNDNPTAGFFQQYTSDQIKNWIEYNATDPNHYPITDWKGMMMRSSAPRMTHNLAVNGGNKAVRSKVSMSYDDIDGLYEGRGFQRFMFRANNDFNISKKLSASADINIRRAKSRSTIYDPFAGMRKMPAIYAAVWDDGRLAEGKSGANPYALLTAGGNSVSHSTQIGGKGSLTFKPIEGLQLQAIVSPFINYTQSKAFQNAVAYTIADDPDVFGGWMDSGTNWATNKLSETRNTSWHVTSQLIANYMLSVGKNDLTVMAGFENYVYKTDQLSAARDHFELTNYPFLNNGSQDYQTNSGTGQEYRSNSYFGRILYSFDSRYLFQANIRHDGSSRFGKDYRWGTFPSFSAGWVFTQEKWMQDATLNSWLSYGKLRASWGKLGNERIGSYFPYMSLITFGNSHFYENGQVVSDKSASIRTLAVKDITWETTTSTDLGLDLYMFNSHLRFTGDYYWKKTDNMLLSIEIPYFMGYSNPNTNAGKMSTHGYDLELSWNDRCGEVSYGVNLNFSDFISKIDYLNNADIISSGKIHRAGEFFNAWYGYQCEGIFQTQDEVDNSPKTSNTVTVGDLKYKDISGPDGVPDGIISQEYDRVILGNSLPRYQYGATLTASWKGIDFSVVFQGIGKQNSYLDRAMIEPLRDNYGNIPALLEGKYWSVFNTEAQNMAASYPRLTNTTKSNNYATSDFWIFNGRYFRCKNMTLGYTFPSKLTSKASIKKARIYFSASDLFCIDNYPKGWDPEMGTSAYPITTSLVGGLSVTF